MKKNYSYKTLSMLIAALSILENFDSKKEKFVAESKKLDDPFADNLKADIEFALKEYFGINSKEHLKETTKLVKKLQAQAKDDLLLLKTQIERGYRKDRERLNYLLVKLGFKAAWAKASKSNQTELIGLLLTISNNLSTEIRSEMEQTGVNPTRLDSILLAATELHKANITQETLKGTSKLQTAKANEVLNEIYALTMDICHLGQRIYKGDANRKSMFVFSQVVKKQGTSPSAKGANDDKSIAA